MFDADSSLAEKTAAAPAAPADTPADPVAWLLKLWHKLRNVT